MTTFVRNAGDVARKAMDAINPNLTEKYVTLIDFLKLEEGAASKMRGKNPPEIGSAEYITSQANSFSKGRVPKRPKNPSTVPDEVVSFILHHYFALPLEGIKRAQKEHQLSMAAENMVGDLLERYLASILETQGWVWCSGSVVKAVDFIKPPQSSGDPWRRLQVKNRINSENSSSSAIRSGTSIEKWFRTFSRKNSTNWTAFPDTIAKELLSEDGFKAFTKDYLLELKRQT